MKKILNSIDTLNAVGKYSPVMETESGKLTLNERKEWLKLKYPNSRLKTNIIYVLSNPKMIVARSELLVNDRLLSTGTGTSMYEGKTGCITNGGVYTIVAESAGQGSEKGWGKLKSGAGWISLDYCTKR